MVIGSPRSFFWRRVSVVTFLRGLTEVETGADVDKVSSKMVESYPAAGRQAAQWKTM